MKKIITITLVDDRKIEVDITAEKIYDQAGREVLLLNAPVDHPAYLIRVSTIAMGGYTDRDRSNDKRYSHIAPSQIKSVSLEFREHVK